MQRLRTTFQRSRTPTGNEMKTQSSLEVPKQIRSASFDEIQAKRLQTNPQSSDPNSFLRVPQFQNTRSKSVDSNASDESGNFLEVPSKKFPRRKSSGARPFVCVHCMYLEESKQHAADKPPPKPPDFRSSLSISEFSSSSSDEDVAPIPQCSITVTVSPTPNSPPPRPPPPILTSPTIEYFPPESEPSPPATAVRRRSIQRQEAFLGESTGNSLEDMKDVTSEVTSDGTSEGALSEGDCIAISDVVVRDIYLKVPDIQRDRAASVDSCFSKVSQGKTEELQHSGVSLEVPVGPNVALRSRSVDIVLPTDEQARYKALAMAAPPDETSADRRGMSSITVARKRRLAGRRYQKRGKRKSSTESSERTLRNTPDWTEGAIDGDHLWVPTSVSGDFCYVGDHECTKHGIRLKCSACNIVAHQKCIPILLERIRFTCKPTFRDVGLRQYREQSNVQHHWVHRRSEKGKCKQCGKSFQSKLSFGAKEIVAINCSWCKVAFHNKETCFGSHRMEEPCNLGVHSSIIVPPSWIIKLPGKGNFKSSLRKSSKKNSSNKRRNKEKDKDHKAFVIKPIPSKTVTPVIVFINPKSGGNQGTKLLQKFQWLLNPRQVFDLTQGGPKMGLEFFKKVPNLRVLACGGDGTVGWVLSVIDQIGISPAPAVGVLPLGTGNDLARALGWGGGYTDEPISKILMNISNSETVLLDRWSLEVEKNPDADPNEGGKDNLPLNVVNNYFSLGVDAHIALEFHEAREAHPEKFNSRLRNKMFYGQMGGKDLLKRKWKGLAELVTLECDGRDLTPKLKELKVHAIVFLNIPSYGGGTRPWNRAMGSSEPNTDDGLIEVVGLTTYQLPLLQAGGHGTCITQCKNARIITSKTIPMQVDGEACKLAPSIINLTLLNKATMLAKRKGGGKHHVPRVPLEDLTIQVHRIAMKDYEHHHYDRDMLTQSAIKVGTVEVNPMSDLEQVRAQIDQFMEECNQTKPAEWCFLDSCTAERFFRIDKAQEHLHYVSDIAYESLYILDCGSVTVPQTPEDDSTVPSASSMHTTYMVPEMKVSSEGSLDSPSDHPPISPKTALSPDDDVQQSIPVDKQNGERRLNIYNAIKIKSDVIEKPNEALIKAAIVGDLQTIKKIHSMGHSLTTTDSSGQTILHHAVRNSHKEIVKYVLSTAPTSILEAVDNAGQSALHKAAFYRCRNICCMLIAAGASLEVKDQNGLTPRLLAIQVNDHDLGAYLESQEHFRMISNDLGSEV